MDLMLWSCLFVIALPLCHADGNPLLLLRPGEDWSPETLVEIKTAHYEGQILVTVDTGSDTTLIGNPLGDELFKKIQGETIHYVMGETGAMIEVRRRAVEMTINGTTMQTVRVNWILSEMGPILGSQMCEDVNKIVLGRMDIYENFLVAFDRKKREVLFLPHNLTCAFHSD